MPVINILKDAYSPPETTSAPYPTTLEHWTNQMRKLIFATVSIFALVASSAVYADDDSVLALSQSPKMLSTCGAMIANASDFSKEESTKQYNRNVANILLTAAGKYRGSPYTTREVAEIKANQIAYVLQDPARFSAQSESMAKGCLTLAFLNGFKG
jgi:hypothetical protein